VAETQNSRAKGKSLGKYCVAGGLGKSVAKPIRKQKEFRCIASLAIVLSEQNRLVLSKDIVRNGSHQALRCFAQHISWSQILNNGLILIHKNRKNFKTKRWLKKGAIPSLDYVVSGPQVQAISARERKQVNIIMHKLLVCGILKLLHIHP
jgi:hypothetical protein